jgi:hypothetical protein
VLYSGRPWFFKIISLHSDFKRLALWTDRKQRFTRVGAVLRLWLGQCCHNTVKRVWPAVVCSVNEASTLNTAIKSAPTYPRHSPFYGFQTVLSHFPPKFCLRCQMFRVVSSFWQYILKFWLSPNGKNIYICRTDFKRPITRRSKTRTGRRVD